MTDPACSSLPADQPVVAIQPKQLGFGPLFWAIRDAVVVGDASSGMIVLWNPAAERIFGYTAEEAVGRPFAMLFPERLHEQHQAALAAFLVEGRRAWDDPGTIRQLPAVHRSGAELIIEYTVSPLEGEDHQTYLLGIVRDVTERTHLEAERDALLTAAQDHVRRAADLAALKADFTAMVAHELGTPLATIQALVDLVGREELTATERGHILATIRTEAQLVQRLVVDMQVTDTLEQDDFAVDPQPVAVATLLAEAAASVQDQLRGHAFQVDPVPVAQVRADADRIGQVLRNLLGNAAKHTPPGTPVTLQAQPLGGRVRIEVVDQGPGIHPDDLARIFRKFGRGGDATGQRLPGVGLGLYLSRRIIQAHGSDLAVDSEPGAGSTFAFDLEVVTVTADD